MKKVLALVLALVVMATALVGCGDNTVEKSEGNFTDVDYKVNEEAVKFEDSSDMPDWTGNQLELTMWYANGSYSGKKNNISTDDVVHPNGSV